MRVHAFLSGAVLQDVQSDLTLVPQADMSEVVMAAAERQEYTFGEKWSQIIFRCHKSWFECLNPTEEQIQACRFDNNSRENYGTRDTKNNRECG